MLNSSEDMVETISDMPIGTGLLAFRDLEQILKEHVQVKKALDFGCGAGRSTRLLSKYGFYTIIVAQAAMGKKETKVSDLCKELNITRAILYRYVNPTGDLRKAAESMIAGR